MFITTAVRALKEEGTLETPCLVRCRRETVAHLILAYIKERFEPETRWAFPLRNTGRTTSISTFQRELAQDFDRPAYASDPGVRARTWAALDDTSVFQSEDHNGITDWLRAFALVSIGEDLRWNEDWSITARPVLEPLYSQRRWADSEGRVTAARVRVL